MFTLIPAFGRDYKSAKAVYAGLDAGHEFESTGVVVPGGCKPGGYVSKKELLEAKETRVMIRYNKKKTQGVFGIK